MSALAHSYRVLPILFLLQVAETTVVPMPFEAVYIALCLAARDRIWMFLLVTTAGSACAGMIMYTLGATIVEPISIRLGIEAALEEYTSQFADRGASFIFLGATTPAPSYLINLAAGASAYPFWEFLGIFSSGRFLRFAILGGLIFLFGEPILRAWSHLPRWLRTVLFAVLIAGIVYWFVSGFTD